MIILYKNKKSMAVLHRAMKALAENEVKDLLKKYKIPTTNYVVVNTEDNLKDINLAYPLAFKVCLPDILHKTDVEGVKLNVQDYRELLKTFQTFKKKFSTTNFLVEEMEKKGIEIIAGLINDSTFGLSIMVGIGGIFTELYNDVSFRIVPITRDDAKDMISELKGKKIFDNFRNISTDKKALVDLLLKLSHLGVNEKVNQMDLNPIFLYDKGLVVVDAKLIQE